MATEKFQQIVWQIIKDCPGAYNLHDDLPVVGADDKEHDELGESRAQAGRKWAYIEL